MLSTADEGVNMVNDILSMLSTADEGVDDILGVLSTADEGVDDIGLLGMLLMRVRIPGSDNILTVTGYGYV